MTVPVAATPPTTLLWDNVTADTRVVTVRVAVLLTALYVPVSVTVAFVVTVVVVTANVAVVVPAATVTEAGTVAFVVSELVSATLIPPVLAFPFSVTVPVEVAPATTEVGLRTTDEMSAGLTVRVAVTAVCCLTAETVTGVGAATPKVVTVNVTDVAPAGTVTEVGTVAVGMLELERKTGTPPVGAAAEIVTVPVEGFPPTTVAGASARPVGRGAVAVSVALAEEVPTVAEMTVPTSFPTATVVAVNVAVEAAASTVTDAGIVTTAVADDDKVTTVPPTGAGPLRVTVPVDVWPPVTTGALNATDRTTGEAVSESTTVFVAPP